MWTLINYWIFTLTAINPPSRFGYLKLNGNYVEKFDEKPTKDWINGGFFVCEPDIFNYIDGDEPIEQGALTRMTDRGLLTAYKHEGFWQMADTAHDIRLLEKYWKEKGEWK
jgi:glucose-1-phosphate cytidylyltransferase